MGGAAAVFGGVVSVADALAVGCGCGSAVSATSVSSADACSASSCCAALLEALSLQRLAQAPPRSGRAWVPVWRCPVWRWRRWRVRPAQRPPGEPRSRVRRRTRSWRRPAPADKPPAHNRPSARSRAAATDAQFAVWAVSGGIVAGGSAWAAAGDVVSTGAAAGGSAGTLASAHDGSSGGACVGAALALGATGEDAAAGIRGAESATLRLPGAAAAVVGSPEGCQPTGGITCTMLPQRGQLRMLPTADSSLTLSRARHVVHWMPKSSTICWPVEGRCRNRRQFQYSASAAAMRSRARAFSRKYPRQRRPGAARSAGRRPPEW